MFSRRRFLKAIFGASLSAVTRPTWGLVEALTTRKIANQVLSAVTATQILDARMVVIPYIPLLETLYVE